MSCIEQVPVIYSATKSDVRKYFHLQVDRNRNAATASWGETSTELASGVLNILKSCLASVRRVFFLLSAENHKHNI